MNRARPDVRIIIIPHCSHAMPREMPLTVVEHILAERKRIDMEIAGDDDGLHRNEMMGGMGVVRKRHPMFTGTCRRRVWSIHMTEA